MQDPIETSRLRLVRLTNTTEGSQHVQWFHEIWSDEATTGWSLHGKCHNLTESREWMIEQMTKLDNILYAIFVPPSTPTSDFNSSSIAPGTLVGTVGLRLQQGGPTLPPPPPPSSNPTILSSTTPEPTNGDQTKPLNLRVIGYCFFESAWGKGYATEASNAVLDAYKAFRAKEKKEGKEIFYVEAGVDKDHLASISVLKKLGFMQVGWKVVKEPVFLAGAWREPGYWIYGMYV